MTVDENSIMKHISAFYDSNTKWRKKFAWLPKKSSVSESIIWLRYYWIHNISMVTGTNVPVNDLSYSRIFTETEFLVEKLKNHENNETHIL